MGRSERIHMITCWGGTYVIFATKSASIVADLLMPAAQ
jgi:hypothetical protein